MKEVDHVLSQLDDVRRSGRGWVARCPGHDDRKPSLSVGVGVSGTPLVHCHAGCSQASLRRLLGLGNASAPRVEPRKNESPRLDVELLPPLERALLADAEALAYAEESLGWKLATIERLRLGWSASTRRYAVPIFDEGAVLRNIRLYDPFQQGEIKWISWKEGYGAARLYPIEALSASTIVVCEGEKDAILMNQVLTENRVAGWSAVTGTGGAGTWNPEWSLLFSGKDVVLAYDRDPAGELGASNVALELRFWAKTIRIVRLDLAALGADITDYFLGR